MSQPVLLRSSISVAFIRLAQAILPPLGIVASLYLITVIRHTPFDHEYLALAALAALLSGLLLQPRATEAPILQIQVTATAFNVALRWAASVGLLFGFGYVSNAVSVYPRNIIIPWIIVSLVVTLALILALQLLMRRVVLTRQNRRSAVIVGMNQASVQLADRLMQHQELCTNVAGFFDDRSRERLDTVAAYPLLGKLADLVTYVQTHRIEIIFVSLPIRHVRRVMMLLDDLQDSTASIYYVPDVFVFDLIQSRTADIMGVPVVAMRETPLYGYRGVMKRITDLGFTMVIVAIMLLPMLLIALLVRLTSRGPAIFKQRRYGLDGKEIVVYKFRTMRVTEDGAAISQATRDDPRITPIGRVLRRFSLDELPQLFNVLQGRMSLVGPRPHAVAHNEHYRRLIKGYMIRHKVLPGITGLAQVRGFRGETAELELMQARVNLDLEYLRRWSPSLDLQILVKTALQTLFDRKAY